MDFKTHCTGPSLNITSSNNRLGSKLAKLITKLYSTTYDDIEDHHEQIIKLSKVPLFITKIDSNDIESSTLYIYLKKSALGIDYVVTIDLAIKLRSKFVCSAGNTCNGDELNRSCDEITQTFGFNCKITNEEDLRSRSANVIRDIMMYIQSLRYTSCHNDLLVPSSTIELQSLVDNVSKEFSEFNTGANCLIELSIPECSVCYEHTTTKTICDHLLCHSCSMQLLDNRCPICRVEEVKLKCRHGPPAFTFEF